MITIRQLLEGKELIQELLGRSGGLFPVALYRAGAKSDWFYFRVSPKGEGFVYEYGPFNREATKRYLRQLDARINDLAYIPAILDATKGRKTAWIKVDASELSKIWTPRTDHAGGQTHPKKARFYQGAESDGDLFLEEFNEIMKSNNQSIEDALGKILKVSHIVLDQHPEIRLAHNEDAVRTIVESKVSEKWLKDQGVFSEDVVQMIVHFKETKKAPSLIDLALSGVSADRIVSSILEEEHSPFDIGSSVIRSDAMREGVVTEIRKDFIQVTYENGEADEFTWKEASAKLVARPERIVEGLTVGAKFFGDNSTMWEISGIDYLTKRVLAVDPQDSSLYTFIDIDEFNNKVSTGAWKFDG